MATEIRENFVLDEVARRGQKIANKYRLPTDREATRDEILHCNNSFPQLLGRHGDVDQVAALSFGLAGGIETLEPVVEKIRQGLGRVEWYGTKRDQVAVFIEEDVDPDAMIGRLIDGPKDVYQDLTGLKSQVAVQEDRRQSLLESPGGKGRVFEEVFYGRTDAWIKGYQGDGTAEFLLNYKVRGRELWGAAMDDQPQSMTSLALHENVDPEMRRRLLEIQNYLAETPKGSQRFVLTMNADKTVFCCNNATNAQLERKTVVEGRTSLPVMFEDATFGFAPPVSTFLENSNDTCPTCKKSKKEKKCSCSAKKTD